MKKPLLLVDDNDDLLEILRDRLEALSYSEDLSVARDGVEALAFLRKDPPFDAAPTPALVFLDIRMPRKDGHEVLAEMKADPVLREIPVVMLTSSDLERDRERATSAGAALYLTKLPSLNTIREVLERFTGRRNPARGGGDSA